MNFIWALIVMVSVGTLLYSKNPIIFPQTNGNRLNFKN